MLRHVKLIVSFLFVGVAFLYACRSKEVAPQLPPDYFAIEASKSVSLVSGLTVRVDSIFDNRCPIGSNCFFAGSASALLTLNPQTDPQKRRLFVGNSKERSDSTTVQFQNITYKVILRGVIPYPSSENLKPKRQAVIQVSRL